MKLLKGIDRCNYISKVLDNINYLIWVKDSEDNLIFANNTAFNFFKRMTKNEIIKCPVNIDGHEENKSIKIKIDNKDIWLQFSSMPINIENHESFKGILVFAYDITKRREKENEVSRILDEKIGKWKQEQDERALRLEENNKEMYAMLNLTEVSL